MRERELSPVEVVDAYLERIEAIDSKVRAYITVCGDEARAQAREAEAAISKGDYIGPMHGIPVAVKDQFDTNGIKTTMGSRIFSENVPDGDSTVVTKLRESGSILLGKLNMTEFAFGDTREYVFGTPRNPWNLDRSPGMSSSGSGIAVSAGMTAVAIGRGHGGVGKIPGLYVRDSRAKANHRQDQSIPGVPDVAGPWTLQGRWHVRSGTAPTF